MTCRNLSLARTAFALLLIALATACVERTSPAISTPIDATASDTKAGRSSTDDGGPLSAAGTVQGLTAKLAKDAEQAEQFDEPLVAGVEIFDAYIIDEGAT